MRVELEARRAPSPVPDEQSEALRVCRAVLAANSRSFSLSALLLPRAAQDHAAALYAYCRRVDDAIDLRPQPEQEAALARLHRDLAAVYAGQPAQSAELLAFRALVETRRIPVAYPHALLLGMGMDVRGARYASLDQLLLYCHRVAAVVGLMMCHVLGVRRDSALVQAAQLGIAMQLTNICRDVAEDAALGRSYLPSDWLNDAASFDPERSSDRGPRAGVQRVIHRLLAEADRYYEAARQGIPALPFRAGLAVRAALHLYRALGGELRLRDCDPARGRAVVPRAKQLWLVARAVLEQVASLPLIVAERLRHGLCRLPAAQLEFPDEVLAPRNPERTRSMAASAEASR